MNNDPQTTRSDDRIPPESLNRLKRATSITDNQSIQENNVYNEEQNVDDINFENHFKSEKKQNEQADSKKQDTRVSRFSHQKLLLVEKSILGITSCSILLNVIRLWLKTDPVMPDSQKADNEDLLSQINSNMLIALSFCTIAISKTSNYQAILVIVRKMSLYQLELDQKIKFRSQSSLNNSTFYNFIHKSGEYKQLLLEIVLCAFHPNIFAQNQIKEQDFTKVKIIQHSNPPEYPIVSIFTFQSLLQVLFLIKIYLVIRSVISLTMYATPRAARMCNNLKTEHSVFFSMKCIFHDHPVFSWLVTYFLMIFCLGLGLRSTEFLRYTIIHPSTTVSFVKGFWKLQNCIWCAFITMTTIGYGDYAPTSILGRYFTIIFSIFGVILNSTLLISVFNYLQMLSSESKADFTQKILKQRESLKKQAEVALSKTIEMSHLMDQGAKKKQITEHFQGLKQKIDRTKMKIKEIKNMRSNEEYMIEDISSSFCRVQRQCQEMYRNQVRILKTIKGVESRYGIQHKFKIQYFKEVQSKQTYEELKTKTLIQSEEDNIQWLN